MDDAQSRQDLTRQIEERRGDIKTFLRQARPRRNRLTSVSIVGSAVVAALTAGPGFGRDGFTSAVSGALSLSSTSIVWQVICILASVLSLAAAIASGLANSRNSAEQISAAESASAQLEGLQTALKYGQLPLGDAARLYQEYSSKAAFID
jgi:cytochrome bd-type quinol oxidase subunit 2